MPEITPISPYVALPKSTRKPRVAGPPFWLYGSPFRGSPFGFRVPGDSPSSIPAPPFSPALRRIGSTDLERSQRNSTANCFFSHFVSLADLQSSGVTLCRKPFCTLPCASFKPPKRGSSRIEMRQNRTPEMSGFLLAAL